MGCGLAGHHDEVVVHHRLLQEHVERRLGHLRPRLARPESGHERDDDVDQRGAGRGDAHVHEAPGGDGPRGLLGSRVLGEDAPGDGEERLSRGGEDDPRASTGHDVQAHLALETLQLTAHGGLHQAPPLGGSGHRAGLSDGDEGGEEAGVHDR